MSETDSTDSAVTAPAFELPNVGVGPDTLSLDRLVERAEDWQAQFDLPFPLLADPKKDVADRYDQPTQYGALGKIHDLIGRLPESVILDTRGETGEIVYTYEGESPEDRPAVEKLVEEIEELQDAFMFDCSLVDC